MGKYNYSNYKDKKITIEMIENLRKEEKALEERVNRLGTEEYERTGQLTSPVLNELANELEEAKMTIEKLESYMLGE